MAQLHTLSRSNRRFSVLDYSTISGVTQPNDIVPGLSVHLTGDNLGTGSISDWAGSSGTSYHAIAGISPTVTTAYFAGTKSALFNGSTQYLNFSPVLTTSSSFTLIVLTNYANKDANQILTTDSGVNNQFRIYAASGYTWIYTNGSTAQSTTMVSPYNGITKMLTYSSTAGAVSFYDSKTLLNVNGGIGSATWTYLCHPYGTEPNYYNGAIAEFLLWNGQALSSVQINRLHDEYLKLKYSGDSSFV